MADNYLENKMIDYINAGRSAKPSRRKLSPSGQKAGEVVVKFPSRRVFVTGGAHGIGAAVVRAFANAGCQVAFCDIDAKAGTELAQQSGTRFYPVDVTQPLQLQNALNDMATHWGNIDITVNCVGITEFKLLEELTLEEFDRVQQVNVRPIIIVAKFITELRKGFPPAYGRIINIASTRAAMSERGTEAYSASKGAIVSLTHALMMSMAPLGVTVNCISPGWIHAGETDELHAYDNSFHPSGRVGRPSDIADACLWLAMPDNNFVNGANITIDGGVSRKMLYP